MKQRVLYLLLGVFLFAPTLLIAGSKQCLSPDPPHSIPDISLKLIAEGFDNPVYLTHAGDGSKRLFVVEQPGMVWIIKDGRRALQPFLDIRKSVASGGEKGLLSIAFHPNFNTDKRFYVNYTSKRLGGLRTIISEFTVGEDPDNVDTITERIILTIPQPNSNHNGGQIAFGPDGMLYIGMGDGGSGNDPRGHGQNLQTLLGAMLRIDITETKGKQPELIPNDNPFVGKSGYRGEIWAYGLRNPWRFSFDVGTGMLLAGDVGQNDREEIDIIEKGKNYGWNKMEGNICTPDVNPRCDRTGLELPIVYYSHRDGLSVIGGFVYRGLQVPTLCGVYIYGDYGSGSIWGLRLKDKEFVYLRLLLKTGWAISSFGTDEGNEIYVIDHREGRIFIIRAKQS